MNIVKQKRLELELSQCEVAGKIGVSQATVQRYEKSQSIPKTEVLLKLCDLIKCTPQEVVSSIFSNMPTHM